MDHKDQDLLNKLREFPRHQMDEDQEQEIYGNLLKITRSEKFVSRKDKKKRFIARLATVAVLVLFSVLGISYLQKDTSQQMSQQGEDLPSLVNNEEGKKEIEDSPNNDFVGKAENDEPDIAWEAMDEGKIKIIIHEILHHFLLQIEDIQREHPEWFEKFSLLHENEREYPEEFEQAVDLFRERLEAVFTEEALDEYVEGIIVISFCECDSYTLWSKEDTEKGFQVKEQSRDSFVVTSIVEATDFDPHDWQYEWTFKREGSSWKLDRVMVEERID